MRVYIVRTRFRLQRYEEFLGYANKKTKFLKIKQRPMAYYFEYRCSIAEVKVRRIFGMCKFKRTTSKLYYH